MTKHTGYILKSTRPNGPTFDIIEYDPETKIGVLRGAMGRNFKEDLDKERLKQYGYRIEPTAEVPHGES